MIKQAAVKAEEKRSPYKSIYRTAAILSCINKGITTVSEISNTLKIDKSTIYRLLQALDKAGITLRNPLNRQYYIGPLITQITENPSITHSTLVFSALLIGTLLLLQILLNI